MATPIEVAAAAVRIEPDFTGFGPAVTRGIQRSGAAAAQQAQRLGGTLSAAVTAPLVGLGAAAVREFSNFDQAITESLAIVTDFGNTTREEFESAAEAVARSTTFSATQAAEGFFFLASAGLSAEQQIAALPQVAQFAQAGMFDLATATDLATDAQSALGLTVRDDAVANLENLTRVTDVLVKANTLANASVSQFATALTNRAGAALKLVGKDIEEGVAVLAAFADQGVKAEEAGTRLDIVLRDLQNASLRNRDAFEEYGISVFDAQGEVRNLADIIEELEDAFDGASDETIRQTLLQLGFQDRSVASLLTLVGLSDQIRVYEAELRKASGTTGDIANNQLQSFSAQLTLAKNSLSIAATTIGAELAPALLSVAQFAASAADAFTSLPEPLRNAALVAGALAAAAGPLLLVGGRIAQTILSLRALAAQQALTAGSARTLAAAQSGAALAIGQTGAAASAAGAAGAAGLAAGRGGAIVRNVAGVGAFTVGRRGVLARAGGAAARTLGRGALSGAGLAAGLGISFAGELGASLVSGIKTQEGTVGDALKDTASGALRGAGIGATVGSIIPGIGTGIGAGVGALVGGAIGFFRRGGGNEAIADEVEGAVREGAEVPPEVAQLQGQALANTIQGVIDASLEDGLGVEAAGERAAAVREAIETGLAEGLTFEEARAQAIAGIDGLIDDVQGGLQEGIDGVSLDPANFASILTNVYGEAKDVSSREIEDLVIEQQQQFAKFEEAVQVIYAAGASKIAEELNAAGPGAVGEASALAADIVTALRVEGRLRGVAEENLDEYVAALQAGNQGRANILEGTQTEEDVLAGFRALEAGVSEAGEDVVEAFIGTTGDALIDGSPALARAAEESGAGILVGFGDILTVAAGERAANDFGDGVARGLAAQSARWAAIAANSARNVTTAVRGQWEISSPSRVGLRLGESFAEGVNLGVRQITSGPVPVPDLTGGGGSRGGNRDLPAEPSETNITINVNNPTERSIPEGVEKGLAYARLAAS